MLANNKITLRKFSSTSKAISYKDSNSNGPNQEDTI
jgi:hypothetical protein